MGDEGDLGREVKMGGRQGGRWICIVLKGEGAKRHHLIILGMCCVWVFFLDAWGIL